MHCTSWIALVTRTLLRLVDEAKLAELSSMLPDWNFLGAAEDALELLNARFATIPEYLVG